jgi:hypothetical protein
MDAVLIPFLPASLWLLATSAGTIIVIVSVLLYCYYRARLKAVIGDHADSAVLAATKTQLEADVAILSDWQIKHKNEILHLEAERQQQEILRAELARLEQEMSDNRTNREHIIASLTEKQIQFSNLEKYIVDLNTQKDKNIEKINNLNEKYNIIKNAYNQLIEKFNEQKVIENQKQNDLKEINNQINQTKIELEEKNQLVKNLDEKYSALNIQFDNLNEIFIKRQQKLSDINDNINQDDKKLKIIISDLQSARDDLNFTLNRISEAKDQYNLLINTNQKLEILNESLLTKINDLKAEEDPLNIKIQQIKDKLARLNQDLSSSKTFFFDIQSLEARKAVLESDIKRLNGQLEISDGGSQTNDIYTDIRSNPPICLSNNEFKNKNKEENEIKLLNYLKNELSKEGLYFSDRIINAFHTSLKCHDINPLTVLAGVSGTGKTLLPIRYAELMGINKLVMAVQPRWDSPQDLFGFYNYLEKRYKATDLSKALVLIDPYNFNDLPRDDPSIADQLLLVLLDEMNLARTEYYFSEFLSKLELRRLVTQPTIQNKRLQAELELDSGPGKKPLRIWVPKNVFFVGTMNEDESTQSLSDKVLDRSNVLRFGKPSGQLTKSSYRSDKIYSEQREYLTLTTWNKWIKKSDQHDHVNKIKSFITRLNDAMNDLGHPFGYRVAQAIELYVANYPSNDNDNNCLIAFADQIEQKIMPKLRGIDFTSDKNRATLNKIGNLISELNDNDLAMTFTQAQKNAGDNGLFHWSGVSRHSDQGL